VFGFHLGSIYFDKLKTNKMIRFSKKLPLLFLFFTFSLSAVLAEKPIVKVDLNIAGRQDGEVNEPGYTPWVVQQSEEDVLTIDGINFKIRSISSNSNLRTGWSKADIQGEYLPRLANDGVTTSDNDGGDIEFVISGLPAGTHSIQTFHSTWDNPVNNVFSPVSLYLNDVLVKDNVSPTNRVAKNNEATTLYVQFSVVDENEEVVLRYESLKSFTTTETKPDGSLKNLNINVCINGFELNTPYTAKQAKNPFPLDGDIHAPLDENNVTLLWEKAPDAIKSILYFSTDKELVKSSDVSVLMGEFTSSTSYYVDDLYSMNNYYWKVDQEEADGTLTEGQLWSFRPRQLAFRGAEGYGRFATGGRGGKVVYVTNLNDDGPGSLREAITNDIGPRTILFNVSGIITLNSRLTLNQPFVTIAGQSAPGKGILIRSAPLGIGSEAICRFIRVRLGAGDTADALGMAGADHSIVDHCSLGWSIDEAFSSRNSKNITLQWTMISEALNIAGHKNYPEGSGHGYAATIGGDIASFHHNLLAHCYGRNWSLGGGLDGNGYYAGRLDIFNNVVYNWGSRATDGGAHEVNFVGNYYKKGAATRQNTILRAQLEGAGKGSQSYYYYDNIVENTNGSLACDGTDDSCSRSVEVSPNQVVDWEVFVDAPFFPSYATVESAKDAYKSVLSDVGCTMPMFDEHDQRIIQETMNGTYTYIGSKTQEGGIIDHENDAGGFESYPVTYHEENFDSDMDGLPDWWEILHGTDPYSPEGDFSDSNADVDGDGYTALEDYLEWMSVPRFYISNSGAHPIDLSPLVSQLYKSPVLTVVKSDNLNVTFNNKVASVKALDDFVGIAYLDFKITDSENSIFNRRVGILVEDNESTSIKSVKETNLISVYPQIFSDEVNIDIHWNYNAEVNIEVMRLDGVIVYKKDYTISEGHNKIILNDLKTLSPQPYILKIKENKGSKVGEIYKLIKI